MKIKTLAIIATTALALSACSGKENANTDVKARQDIMQDWRIAGDVMKGMMEKPETFDAAAFKEQADNVVASTAHVWTHFASDADKGGSQDSVWTNKEGFKAKADEFDAAAKALSEAAATAKTPADVEAALGKFGESCGSCHKEFKQK